MLIAHFIKYDKFDLLHFNLTLLHNLYYLHGEVFDRKQ